MSGEIRPAAAGAPSGVANREGVEPLIVRLRRVELGHMNVEAPRRRPIQNAVRLPSLPERPPTPAASVPPAEPSPEDGIQQRQSEPAASNGPLFHFMRSLRGVSPEPPPPA